MREMKSAVVAEPSSEEESEEDDGEKVAADRWAKARGLAGSQSSSEDGSSSGEEDMYAGVASEEEVRIFDSLGKVVLETGNQVFLILELCLQEGEVGV